jgi:hypothetical protein
MIYRGTGFLATYNLAPPHPFPSPSPISKLDRRHTGKLRKRENIQTGENGRGWRRSQIIRRLESLVLYKSFKTLWCGRFFYVESTVQRDGYIWLKVGSVGTDKSRWLLETEGCFLWLKVIPVGSRWSQVAPDGTCGGPRLFLVTAGGSLWL